jgi:hypothetical protein
MRVDPRDFPGAIVANQCVMLCVIIFTTGKPLRRLPDRTFAYCSPGKASRNRLYEAADMRIARGQIKESQRW